MSPEQVVNRGVSPASDLFALGSLLATAALGQNPFDGDSLYAVHGKILEHEPDLSGLSQRMRQIIAPCLAKDPGGRPSPAAVLAAVGDVPAKVRPWPMEVHSLIERQRADVARLLEGTTVDLAAPSEGTAPTLVDRLPFPASADTTALPASASGEDSPPQRNSDPTIAVRLPEPSGASGRVTDGAGMPATLRIARRLYLTAAVLISFGVLASPAIEYSYLYPFFSFELLFSDYSSSLVPNLLLGGLTVAGIVAGLHRMRRSMFLFPACSVGMAYLCWVNFALVLDRLQLYHGPVLFLGRFLLVGIVFVFWTAFIAAALVLSPAARNWTDQSLE